MPEQDAPAGVPFLLLRVRRRLARLARARRARLRDRDGAELTDAEYERRCAPSDNGAPTLPGGLVSIAASTPDDVRKALDDILHHTFDHLGSGPTKLIATEPAADGRRERFDRLTAELSRDAEQYRPIEWHSDWIAGHRWDPAEYYLDVRVAPRPGADIKVPRELSRFQHVGVLASAGREDGLHDRAGVELALEMMDWIAANPVRRGVNWASTMDVSIRAVNWIWGLRLFEDVFATLPNTTAHVVRSLYEHGLHIEENLEYAEERTTNHYLANVAGLLYIAAALPQFPETDRWLHIGLQELVSEMRRQVYDDGADFEASTHYHRLVAEMFLSCAALAERLPRARVDRVRARPGEAMTLGPRLRPLAESDIAAPGRRQLLPPSFYESLARMIDFTSALTKPSGLVPQFGDNDSARLHKLSYHPDDDVRDHRHLLAVAALLGHSRERSETRICFSHRLSAEAQLIAGGLDHVMAPPAVVVPKLFPNAGIAVLRQGNAYLAVTCGPNGQHGRGGHGHNDKASFELTIGDQDYVVDGGSFVYTSDPAMRNRFRSTEAHSTIWVDGREQDELPPGLDGLFALPGRSHPRLELTGESSVVAEHTGFGSPHRRTLTLSPNRLEIDDDLRATGIKTIGFNLDPAVRASLAASPEPTCFVLDVAGRPSVWLTLEGVSSPRIEDGYFSLGYGVRVANQRILATLVDGHATSTFEWDS